MTKENKPKKGISIFLMNAGFVVAVVCVSAFIKLFNKKSIGSFENIALALVIVGLVMLYYRKSKSRKRQ